EWRETKAQSTDKIQSLKEAERKNQAIAPTPAIAIAPTPSKNNLRQQEKKMAQIEDRIDKLEQELNDLSTKMAQAGNDFSKIKVLGENYQKTEQALASAWAELETI
ncbi:MAG: ABC transporter C-terminal domain-containing protein, partial [Chloroflexota bacterium]